MKNLKYKNQKVDRDEIETFAVASCLYIESWNTERVNELEKPNLRLQKFSRPKKDKVLDSTKTAAHKRLATKIKTELYNDKRIKDEDRIALATYHGYLTELRNYIEKNTNLVHCKLKSNIEKLKQQYKTYADELQTIADADARTVGLAKHNVIKMLLDVNSVESGKLINALKKTPTDHALIANLTKDANQSLTRKKDIDSNLEGRKKNKRTISFKTIYNTIDKLLLSNSYTNLAIGIALATGRRAIEVLYRGTFEATSSQHEILFGGQAKKGYGVTTEKYKFPVIIEASRIIDAVDRLRANKALQKHIEKSKKKSSEGRISTNKALNLRVAGALNRRIKSLFDDKWMVFKDTRVIAINVAIARIYPQPQYNTIDINVFVKRFAGHDDFEEFKNYQHIQIDEAKAEDLNVGDDAPEEVNKDSLETLVKILRGISWKSGRLSSYTKIIDGIESKQKEKFFKITQTSIIKGKISSGRVGISKFLNDSKSKAAIAAFHKANNL
jgi:hypothetical protein